MNALRSLAAGLAVFLCAAAAAAPMGGPHADPSGRTAVLVGQTRDGIRDYVLGSRLATPWGLTMYVAPTLDSGGFTLADGRRSETAAWYAEGFGPQDLGFITGTPELQAAPSRSASGWATRSRSTSPPAAIAAAATKATGCGTTPAA